MKDITPKQTALPAVFKKIPACQLATPPRLRAGIGAAAGRAERSPGAGKTSRTAFVQQKAQRFERLKQKPPSAFK